MMYDLICSNAPVYVLVHTLMTEDNTVNGAHSSGPPKADRGMGIPVFI